MSVFKSSKCLKASHIHIIIYVYSQLSPCGHPAIADTRYYGQNPDPRRIRFDWKWLPLLRTLAITDTKWRPERVRYNKSWLYLYML